MSGIKKIPVFVFPSSLNFCLHDKASHKQLLTLYNPYEFALRFKVLSTAPGKYIVIDPEGSIAPRTCVDIVVRHKHANLTNCNVTDKFRITLLDHATKQVLGKRDIEATLIEIQREMSGDGEHFHSIQTDVDSSISESRSRSLRGHRLELDSTTLTVVLVLIVATCLVGLFLPTLREEPTEPVIVMPLFLHIGLHLKLILAFTMGLSSLILLEWIDTCRSSL